MSVIKKIKQKQQDNSFIEYDLGAKSGNVIMADGSTLEETVGDLIDRIDKKVDAWFYEGEPAVDKPPSSEWTSEDEKNYHVGDAYYDTLTWDSYRWVYLDGEYLWELILDDTASKAYKLAQENEKKINNMKIMTGATTEAAGAQGFVPAPDKGSADRYLSSEGKWKEIVINDASPTVKGIAKLYAAVGEAVDGSMTQKAITDAVNGVKTTATDAQTKVNGAINKLTLAGKVITWTKVNGDTGTLDLSYSILKGATSTVDGAAGLAPQPKMANAGQYLRGDGQWATPPNTTYQPATKDSNGLMSAADKAKLDGIANSANNYVHPSATAYTAGLYKITTNNLGHVTAATAVGKGDITALGIPGSDTKYGTGTADTAGIGKLYTATGANIDGSMTQKAITDALNSKLNSGATAAAATKLATGRTIQTNLGLTTAATFDGTANVTPGVTGILGIANGGTGRNDGKAVGWSTARQIRVNLATTTAVTVDGTANKDLSVTGTLPIGNGGTGRTDGKAVALATPRQINGVNFDGSANITIADNTKLPLAGGTLTGDLTFSGTPRAIKANAGDGARNILTVYRGDANGVGIVLDGGGRTIIGGGEAASSLRGALGTAATNETAEELHLANDGNVMIHSNCQDVAARKTWTFNTSGHIVPPSGGQFQGSITGNAASATKLATARQLRVNLASGTAQTFDGTANKDLSVFGTLPVANGGTGQTTLALARNAMGLGNTTGPLPVANGGTGASDAATARKNLGIASGAVSYVEGEVATGGTWIDGSPIYRYVKVDTITTNKQTENVILSLNIPIRTISLEIFYRLNSSNIVYSIRASEAIQYLFNPSVNEKEGIFRIWPGASMAGPATYLMVTEYIKVV